MLVELKVNGSNMTFEGVAKRVESMNVTTLGQSNAESLRLLGVMMNEVRHQDA